LTSALRADRNRMKKKKVQTTTTGRKEERMGSKREKKNEWLRLDRVRRKGGIARGLECECNGMKVRAEARTMDGKQKRDRNGR
jgi:hypothetical protein